MWGASAQPPFKSRRRVAFHTTARRRLAARRIRPFVLVSRASQRCARDGSASPGTGGAGRLHNQTQCMYETRPASDVVCSSAGLTPDVNHRDRDARIENASGPVTNGLPIGTLGADLAPIAYRSTDPASRPLAVRGSCRRGAIRRPHGDRAFMRAAKNARNYVAQNQMVAVAKPHDVRRGQGFI